MIEKEVKEEENQNKDPFIPAMAEDVLHKLQHIKEPEPKPNHSFLPMNITIIDTRIVSNALKPHLIYITRVSTPDGTWNVSKRYNSFKSLYKNICMLTNQHTIAGFPPNYYHTFFDKDFLNKRRDDLNKFMKDVILLASINNNICKLLIMFFLPDRF